MCGLDSRGARGRASPLVVLIGFPRVSRSGPLEEVRVVHGSEGFLLAFLIFLCQKTLKKMVKNKNTNSKKNKKDTKKKHLIYQPTRYWGARLSFGHFFIF